MDNLESLKEELILQKTAIENMGGTVNVKYTNPSPSEITAGIQTIDCPDITITTATENDVLFGKTFYSQNTTLKTGTLVTEMTADMSLRLYDYTLDDDGSTFYFTFPSEVETLRPYYLYSFPYTGVVNLNEDIKNIGDYAFYKANCTIENFTSLTSLETIGDYSFCGIGTKLDLNYLPSTLTSIGEGGLMDCIDSDSTYSLKVPDNITSLGSYAFANSSALYLDSFSFNNYAPEKTPSYLLMFLRFDCDLEIPSSVTSMARSLNYRGRFNNVIIPSSVKVIGDYCFGAASSDSADAYTMETVTILATTPPSTNATAFYPHYKNSTFQGIFVPDEVVDTYTASSYYSSLVSYIKPLSERPF